MSNCEHSWRFDGDDPYIVCVLCGERRDALTGRTIARPTFPLKAAEREDVNKAFDALIWVVPY